MYFHLIFIADLIKPIGSVYGTNITVFCTEPQIQHACARMRQKYHDDFNV